MKSKNFNLQANQLVEKKQFNQKISQIAEGLLIYNAVMYIAAIGVKFAIEAVLSIIAVLKNEVFNIEAFTQRYSKTDMGMSIAVIIGCIILLRFFYKNIKPKEIFSIQPRKMTKSKFIEFICILMSIQVLISIFGIFIRLFNHVDVSTAIAIELNKTESTSISMLIYTGFIGPFAEEFIYRGYILRLLERTGAGKGYALIISSLLFGIMHVNSIQVIYAFLAGIILGYVALEYNIVWSIILHIINNFIFGDLLAYICKKIPNMSNTINFILFVTLFISAIIICIIKRHQINMYIKEHFKTPNYYYWTFSNLFIWLFIGINIFLATV